MPNVLPIRPVNSSLHRHCARRANHKRQWPNAKKIWKIETFNIGAACTAAIGYWNLFGI
jgi:hypothetical protein